MTKSGKSSPGAKDERAEIHDLMPGHLGFGASQILFQLEPAMICRNSYAYIYAFYFVQRPLRTGFRHS